MRLRLIVPRRSDRGHRDALWRLCRHHWATELPDVEVVEGHHHAGPFNRSAAINAGAIGDWDVAAIVDADITIDGDLVTAGAALALETGQLVLPYKRRLLVNAAGTAAILDGYRGSWKQWARPDTNRTHASSCVIVPRTLWDQVGGFDERFVGWGAEDDAFHIACSEIAGVQRLDGLVWHLHHPPSAEHDRTSPLYRQNVALLHRYQRATPAELRALATERHRPDDIVLVCLTNGRRDTLHDTIKSAEEHLTGPVARRLLIADRCAPSVDGWDTEIIHGGTYPKAMRAALDVALGSGQPWVFWLEDDFTFNQAVDLNHLQALVTDHDLLQLSLMRQAWYPHELEAGGVIAENPHAFTQRDGWISHRAYWTQNPMLTRRATLAAHEWPLMRGSERRYGKLQFSRTDQVAGILGRIDDAPAVTHHGLTQAGTGY